MSYKIEMHGPVKSTYDAQVRAICSQYSKSEASEWTVKHSIEEEIKLIRRANTAIASACYSVRIINEFEPGQKIEVWNDVIPGKERKTVTMTKV